MTTSHRAGASDGAIQVNGIDAVVYNAGGVADKIRTIDASVATNAITITLAPCVLDFRSETLSSGAITGVVNNATLSLTVAATDSFGAVTADGSQRLYILAINNAGTMELAVSRATGGVNLNEEGVITTAATSTTATAILGVGVRTGKAYRVVGCIDVPFTTAVGWGAITLKQGYGGQALAAMSSLGYGQTWQTVTRVIGTTYYNTSSKPRQVNFIPTTPTNWAINGYSMPVTSGVTVQSVIPVGASYLLNAASIGAWSELV